MPTAARRIGLIQQLLKPEMAPNGMHLGGLCWGRPASRGGRSQPAKDGGSGLAGLTCAPEAGLNWIDQHGCNLLLGHQPRACANPILVD